MYNLNVRKDTITLVVLILTVNASILLNHLFFFNYFPISFYIISVVISISIGAFGGLLANYFLMHKINLTPYILHVRGWDTSAGLLKALLQRRILSINIQVHNITNIEYISKRNLLTIHFAEDGLLIISTDLYKRKDIEKMVNLVKKYMVKSAQLNHVIN
ncbi:hypothetical protein JCM14036_26480 [Desulfotomaculum defluvii]